ncbi:neutral and basic amino acid transport protein rBAT-like isoform X1 [Lucilia sericata]|uniref:neutral and basic amino acid transport protein rBAT-like isoform X1 n=1 Tax=Lucilia sericata TaxID=13632 RepID=UPI0018A85B1A|nr:neutral and basic amino acid transport protein rBAT-like isoform X1 [Lucilia sericata]
MNTMGISTDPALLDVELPRTLIESPSVSTFLPEEEASICPLLSSNTNGTTTPLTFSHPLTPCIDNDNDSNTSANLCNEDAKVETSSSSGSSSGIGMSVPDATSTALFNKHSYKHLQKNNSSVQDSNGHGPNGNLQLTNDTPSFVSWNWPLIRKCTFFVFMSSLLAMCAIVVAMIVTLPKTCNPRTAWYRGSVFYEIFPASFHDSDNDGIGDLRGIVKSTDYLKALGVSAIRLNSIFPSTEYPDNYENITSLMEVSHVLGNLEDMHQLSQSLHARNISLILDIPLFPILKVLGKSDGAEMVKVLADTQINNSEAESVSTTTARPIITENTITQALQHWVKVGVDGFYIKGLEKFDDLEDIAYHLAEWKDIIGPNRVLIVNEKIFEKLQGAQRKLALSHVDLVDVHLNIFNGTEYLENRINSILSSDLGPTDTGVWIHWSLAGVDRQRLTRNKQSTNYTLAATIMQLMLPGTPNIFYGDEIALQAAHDQLNEHNETKHLHHLATMQWPQNFSQQFTNRETLPWLPKSPQAELDTFILISKMVDLRDRSPSIYKNSICKAETILPNTVIRRSNDDILIVERTYPRRNTFVSVTNFGQKRLTMDMTSMYYSGHIMLETVDSDKIYFGEFKIGSTESIVVRLDK